MWSQTTQDFLKAAAQSITPFDTNRSNGKHDLPAVLTKIEDITLFLTKYGLDTEELITTLHGTDAAGDQLTRTMSAFLEKAHPIQTHPTTHNLTIADIRSDDGKLIYGELSISEAREMLSRITKEYNFINGIKDGIIKLLEQTFGDYLTQATTDKKGRALPSDKISIPDMIALIQTRAMRPSPDICLAQKKEFLDKQLDFRVHFTTNHAEFLEQANQLAELFGVEITANDLKLIYLPQLEAASKTDWGSQLRDAIRDIKAKYPYGTIYDEVKLQNLVEIVEKYDIERDLTDAPSHLATALEVEEFTDDRSFSPSTYSQIASMMQAGPTAFAASRTSQRSRSSSTSSDSSISTVADSDTDNVDVGKLNKILAQKLTDKAKRDKEKKAEKEKKRQQNGCKHCATYAHTNPHPENVTEDGCCFNPKNHDRAPIWALEKMTKYLMEKAKQKKARKGKGSS